MYATLSFTFITFYAKKILNLDSFYASKIQLFGSEIFWWICALFLIQHFLFALVQQAMRNTWTHKRRLMLVIFSRTQFSFEKIYCANVGEMIRLRKWNVCYVCLKHNIQYRINQLIQNRIKHDNEQRWSFEETQLCSVIISFVSGESSTSSVLFFFRSNFLSVHIHLFERMKGEEKRFI